MHRYNNYGWRLIAAVLAFALAAPAHAGLIRPDDKAIEAIWRVQQVQFDYYSPSASYSCGALKKRIRAILQAVGVHESVEVAVPCDGGGPVNSARVHISFAAPVEATEQNILAATSFKAHELLAARMRGISLPTSTDIERFEASWQRVSLARLHLRSGDCDLLNGLRRQIFPTLRIRSVTGFNCSVAATRLPPALNVDALIRAQIVRPRVSGVPNYSPFAHRAGG